MITIYWHCLKPVASEKDEKFISSALGQLAKHLRKEPIELAISIKRLLDEPELARTVTEILDRLSDQSYTFPNCAFEITEILPIGETPTPTPKLFVYCSPSNPVAVAAQREKPVAKWGGTCVPLAALYKYNNKNGVFHETLHLLGAKDCYEEKDPSQKKPDCNLDSCIMEYNPPLNISENWPFLCDKNVNLLRQMKKNACPKLTLE